MGMGTNRVVGKQLNRNSLNTNQLKGMNMLKSICDVKKQPSIIEEKKQVEGEVKQIRKPNRLKNLMDIDSISETRNDFAALEETKQVNEADLPAELVKNE
jgi:hypothetical protein